MCYELYLMFQIKIEKLNVSILFTCCYVLDNNRGIKCFDFVSPNYPVSFIRYYV